MQAIMETIFESAYLIFAIVAGIFILCKAKGRKEFILFGVATIILGVGDSFHLIPRMIALCTNGLENHVFSLGLGKLVTSITMTIFYVILFYSFKNRFNRQTENGFESLFLALAAARFALCAFHQNEWFVSPSSYAWSIIRNVPFVIMGAMFICVSFVWCRQDKFFKFTWLLVLLSFVFYLLTVLVAPYISIMGMMMLPKTICYIILIVFGIRAVLQN
ncbi:MAG: hypothetical protein IJ538_04090 [Clostridia bacterium]|nr:hypothetical protein [Clostridia bacterium]